MSSNQTLPYNSAVRVTLVVNKANCQCELLLRSSDWFRNNSAAETVALWGLYGFILRSKRLQLVLSTLRVLVVLSWFITCSLKICVCLSASLCSISSLIWGELLFLEERVCSIWSFPSECRGEEWQPGFLAIRADAALSRWAAFQASQNLADEWVPVSRKSMMCLGGWQWL